MTDANPIKIGNIHNGALVDAFELEFARVLANIADESTPATAVRTVTLTLTLKPQNDRTTIETEFRAVSKLAPIEIHKSRCFMGKTEDGSYIAYDSDPRQMPLWRTPQPKELAKPIEFAKKEGTQS